MLLNCFSFVRQLGQKVQPFHYFENIILGTHGKSAPTTPETERKISIADQPKVRHYSVATPEFKSPSRLYKYLYSMPKKYFQIISGKFQ